ncbi:hypothetical protein Gohar_023856 [Gossypium harknessii]|uniref:Uncharacterized protein n=1 Tax=Gossypium harknessii TaxID=34285 RepID=A0A7J9HE80_9ROSI|nr:hypothetical protein [Gossypium harknessii]
MHVSGRAHVIVKSKINVETTTMLVRKLTEGGATSKTTTTTSTKSRFGDITPSTIEKRNQWDPEEVPSLDHHENKGFTKIRGKIPMKLPEGKWSPGPMKSGGP